MNAVTFLIKPASGLCNMRCRYCFYHDLTQLRQEPGAGIMTQDTAEALIRSGLAAAGPGGFVQFTFQGGEPTLAGLEFFKSFLALEKKHRLPGQRISHALQTNGLALDSAWVRFLRENQFLVGLSIDGNAAIHDSYRIDAAGKGTWQRVTQALAQLDQAGVETNLLCVVTSTVAKNPGKVYAGLKALGSHPLQFIPCLDPMEADRGAEPYSLKPEPYGAFLCKLFDLWFQDWKQGRYVSIRLFDDYLRLLWGMAPSSCAASGACGSYLVAESDGSLYPCDFYVLDAWKLGNIHSISAREALASPLSQEFLAQRQPLPSVCRDCPYIRVCRGGCKRDWTAQRENYYCPAFRRFFAYALPRLQQIAASTPRP